jgi:hypothetical protein
MSHSICAMTRIESGSEILKTDKRGRVRTSPERRQELLAEFERSGLSGPKFAAVTGLKYQTLAGWLQRRRKQGAQVSPAVCSARTPGVQWLETVIDKAQAPQGTAGSALIVRLPSGATLELMTPTHAALAGTVLRAWEKAVC